MISDKRAGQMERKMFCYDIIYYEPGYNTMTLLLRRTSIQLKILTTEN